ncbi:uncharacterized protein LOC121590903 [Anopheles merus]|uniref:uncharacterized protein LOC121590903 n=1 Tax=Anopheles merus TaxID=30066 RepID=UPI001BE3D321|nr:uncharacterized protein LOC121590903 [Anopheles merus]
MNAIRIGLEDPTVKLYLTFLKYILPIIKVVPALLSLPHSWACVERLFSQYNLNKNKLRNRLSPEVLEGLLASKEYVKLHKTSNGDIEITSDMKKKFNSNMYNMKNW